ncbi:MAG TPA: AraC family transcriptional regulator [Vicinamibacterales bacterium]|jgi:AraC-like DNA-binding protein
MKRESLPAVESWNSRVGLIEEYEYPAGPAGTGLLHAHREMQVCLSLDFPGRYLYRGTRHDVPVRSVSVLDAWEPHAPSDPIDRDRPAHFIVMYLDPVEFRNSVDQAPSTRIDTAVHVDDGIAARFRRLHDSLAERDNTLLQDERYRELASAVMRPDGMMRIARPASQALLRARDYIAAHAASPIGLAEIAAVADLTPWHFARAFRRQFGLPPHRFQIGLRIDLARRLLADGLSGAEVAHRSGFADQSHFIRRFKRVTGTTPAHHAPARRRSRMGLRST